MKYEKKTMFYNLATKFSIRLIDALTEKLNLLNSILILLFPLFYKKIC